MGTRWSTQHDSGRRQRPADPPPEQVAEVRWARAVFNTHPTVRQRGEHRRTSAVLQSHGSLRYNRQMPELVFKSGADVLFRTPLKTRRCSIGNLRLDDIQLPPQKAPGVQVSLEQGADGYQLINRGEAAVQVNGKPVTTRTLLDGDVIALGELTATFHDTREGDRPRTRRMGGGQPQESAHVYLELEGGRRVRVTDAGVRVGSDESNDVVLAHPFVSGFHAVVFHRAGHTTVKDPGSTNGTFINSVRVVEGEARDGSTVTFGRATVRVVDVGEGGGAAAGEGREFRQVGALLYRDPSMEAVAGAIQSVAASDVPVLITGESGCGKELVARAIHALGPRSSEPFVAVNCAAITSTLLESELFGHERGAFTGAERARAGAFEEAGGGTLFLDEIGDLTADAQAKILRALDNREIRRVGGAGTRTFNCRVVSATHQNLTARVQSGQFRNDLFHRLAVLPIRLPPLRDRRQDIAVLARHVLDEGGHPQATLTAAAMKKLEGHRWPGNIRELRNVLMQAVVLSGKKQIDAEDLTFPEIDVEAKVAAYRLYAPGRTLDEIEAEVMEQAVDVHGTYVAAAEQLDISRTRLRKGLARRAKK